jgi:hypothetical protein
VPLVVGSPERLSTRSQDLPAFLNVPGQSRRNEFVAELLSEVRHGESLWTGVDFREYDTILDNAESLALLVDSLHYAGQVLCQLCDCDDCCFHVMIIRR